MMRSGYRVMVGLLVVLTLGVTAVSGATAIGTSGTFAAETPTETPMGNMSDDSMSDDGMSTETMTDSTMSDDNMTDDNMTDDSMNESMDDGMTETMTESSMDDDMTETEMADDMTETEMSDEMTETAMADEMTETEMDAAGQTETNNPGFGVIVAVVAVLALAFLAARRRG